MSAKPTGGAKRKKGPKCACGLVLDPALGWCGDGDHKAGYPRVGMVEWEAALSDIILWRGEFEGQIVAVTFGQPFRAYAWQNLLVEELPHVGNGCWKQLGWMPEDRAVDHAVKAVGKTPVIQALNDALKRHGLHGSEPRRSCYRPRVGKPVLTSTVTPRIQHEARAGGKRQRQPPAHEFICG